MQSIENTKINLISKNANNLKHAGKQAIKQAVKTPFKTPFKNILTDVTNNTPTINKTLFKNNNLKTASKLNVFVDLIKKEEVLLEKTNEIEEIEEYFYDKNPVIFKCEFDDFDFEVLKNINKTLPKLTIKNEEFEEFEFEEFEFEEEINNKSIEFKEEEEEFDYLKHYEIIKI